MGYRFAFNARRLRNVRIGYNGDRSGVWIGGVERSVYPFSTDLQPLKINPFVHNEHPGVFAREEVYGQYTFGPAGGYTVIPSENML